MTGLLLKIAFKSTIFQHMWPGNFKDDLEKNNRVPLLYYTKLCASFQSHQLIQSGVTIWKHPIWVKIRDFSPCDLEIWRITVKNNRAVVRFDFKLCASFHSQMWIQTGVTVPKCPIFDKINVFFSHVTLKFDRWPWKTIGYLFEATSSFVHHFIAICEFEHEFWSWNC